MVTHFLWHTQSRRGERKIKTEFNVECFQQQSWVETEVDKELLMSVVPALLF